VRRKGRACLWGVSAHALLGSRWAHGSWGVQRRAPTMYNISGGPGLLWECAWLSRYWGLLHAEVAGCLVRFERDLALEIHRTCDLRASARMPALVASTAPCCRRHSRELLQSMFLASVCDDDCISASFQDVRCQARVASFSKRLIIQPAQCTPQIQMQAYWLCAC